MRTRNNILIIVLFALVIRTLFLMFGAEIYFGTPRFNIQGDTMSWVDSILNLIYRGSYSANLASPNGWFYRPPGYSFFIGTVYLLCGKNLMLSLSIIPWIQVVLDSLSTWLIILITLKITNKNAVAYLAGFIYALYPFTLIWTAVVYAESLSIFLLFSALWLLLKGGRNLIYSGIILGLAALTRLQTIFIIPFIALALVYQYKSLKQTLLFITPFLLIFSIWPVRNYFNHNRIMFSQDLHIGKNWSEDYLSFMDYIFSVQTDHKPQFDQIVYSMPVIWPNESYHTKEDSVLLSKAVTLCRTCGTGFSYFMTYRVPGKAIVENNNCDAEIASIFQKLKEHQKKYNPFNYYLKVPAYNLYKSLFKNNLYGNKSSTVMIITSLLFVIRSILIFIGLIGLFLLWKKNKNYIVITMGGFFVAWYVYLCFIYRNIEIRYLLPVDVLLIIPASWFIYQMQQKLLKSN